MFIVNTVLLIRNRSTTFAVVSLLCVAKIVNFRIIPTNDEDFFCDLTFPTKK